VTGGEATQIDSESVGCGRFGRDDLEMLAIAQSDPSAPVVDGIVEHLPKCPACCAVVDRIVADNAFLHELARAASRASRTAVHTVSSLGDGAPMLAIQV
jgi:hypothetical protein